MQRYTVPRPKGARTTEIKTVKQIPFRVDEIVLFQPSRNTCNKTLKRFSHRRSPYAKMHV